MVRFHGTLLAACIEQDGETPGNAATLMRSPYAFGEGSYQSEWMREYRPLIALSVALLEEEPRLLDALAYLATHLERLAPEQPAKLHIQAMSAPGYMAYQLGAWWTRRMQSTGALAAGSGVVLSGPHATTYRNALVSFLGGWSSFHVSIPKGGSDERRWATLCARTNAYAFHIESSARFLLDAVERRDEEASSWFCDQFLKWWGLKAYELKFGDMDLDPAFRRVGLSLAEMPWTEARKYLGGIAGQEAPNIALAEAAINLALRNYWEGLAMVVACQLIASTPDTFAEPPLALRIASSLLARREFHIGGTVEANELASADDALSAFLALCFDDKKTTARIDQFCESRQRDTDKPVVPGWMYGGAVPRTDVESLVDEYVTVLAALVEVRPTGWTSVRRRIKSYWLDTRLLDQVQEFGVALVKAVRHPHLRSRWNVVDALRVGLQRPARSPAARGRVFEGSQVVVKRAREEQALTLRFMAVSPTRLSLLVGSVAKAVFSTQDEKHAFAFCTLEHSVLHGLNKHSASAAEFDIEDLYISAVDDFSESDIRSFGRRLRNTVVEHAIADEICRQSISPLPAADTKTLLTAIAAACAAIRAQKGTPILLVPQRRFPLLTPRAAAEAGSSALTRAAADDASGARFYVDGAPAFHFPTPLQECFILDADRVRRLVIHGDSPEAAFNVVEAGREQKRRVRLTWTWSAAFV